ncbi:MAG: phosphoenolpyruvate synthase [Candidatus Nanoarchaeia archaeon]|nr:phosphoenolpyruvate synthase [Candidatus Nanoarchaeia archaeon]
MSNVIWFKDISEDDIGIVGGKGLNLGIMYNLKFPVPPGFVVTAQAFKDFLETTRLNKTIYKLLEDLDIQDTDKLEKTAKKIQDSILDKEVPEQIIDDIKNAYENISVDLSIFRSASKSALDIIKAGRDIPWVAVRSSATAEDLPETSFAGQQETFLNIKGNDNVVRAVQRCWASLFTARAIYYRTKNNFPHDKVLIAVVVQKMIDSESSGVMFSINPATNNKNEVVIETGFGLGEAIVGGQITPDTYIVDKNTYEIKDKKIAYQSWMYARDEVLRRTNKVQLSPAKAKEQKIPDEIIIKLAEIGKRLEKHYGKPQDVEYAIEHGRVYIVQTRSVTTEAKVNIAKTHGDINATPILTGLGASPGIGSGTVKIVYDIADLNKIQKGDILVTVMTNPDFVVAMQKASAIITDEGGLTSHAAIVSREMGIPCIVGTEKATKIFKEGDTLTVDGTNGKVYKGKLQLEESKKEKIDYPYRETKTKIYMNLGEPDKIDQYKDLYFDGIGLMRLEFVISDKVGEHPNYLIRTGQQNKYIDELYEGIKKVASNIENKPMIVRFSDFKTNEYKDLKGGEEFEPHEDNPMIGWRGVSRYVSEEFKEAFKLECKAILKVREEYKNVYVMLPFVRTVDEVKKCLEIMKQVGLERNNEFKIYLMAEVPSMALIPEEFAELDVDGVSIGSNDLTQLCLGVDRDSSRLGRMGYFDERNPAVLKAIHNIISTFTAKGITVSLCGQSASEYPEIVKFLVKEGITSISVNPDVVNKVRFDVYDVEAEFNK